MTSLKLHRDPTISSCWLLIQRYPAHLPWVGEGGGVSRQERRLPIRTLHLQAFSEHFCMQLGLQIQL